MKYYAQNIALPDGRTIDAEATGFTEGNNVILETVKCFWPDGDELTAEEMNEEIDARHYLHEWALEKGDFEEN